MAIRRFEEIQGWQKSRDLVRAIYRLSVSGEAGKDFGWRDQIRRAAISTMSNIAEGFGRRSGRDFAHYLDTARGSAIEVQSLLYVALDAGYIQETEFQRIYFQADEVISLVAGFAGYLRKVK